ncbi:MAG TPA: N-acetyltransferase [Thermoplasmata archaeon]|nr:N-acetyltransferase [Thermoplasmata archaeon]
MPLPSPSRTDLTIRRANPSDAAPVAEIYNRALEERMATFETESRSESEMRAWMAHHDDRHPILVAVSTQGTVLAWAAVSEYRPRSCYAGVGEFSIYVAHGQRGRGIGKTLLAALIEDARRQGYWKLVSRIFPSNVASRELCKRCGFREVGVYEKHGKLDGKWLDTVIVERLIPENLV